MLILQTRLDGLRSQANVSEQRLLDQITHLQEQLKREQAARYGQGAVYMLYVKLLYIALEALSQSGPSMSSLH